MNPKSGPSKPPPLDPVAILDAFVAAVTAAPTNATIAKHWPTGERFDALARLHNEDSSLVFARLTGIRDMKGLSGRVDDMLTAIKKRAKDLQSPIRLVQPQDGIEAGTLSYDGEYWIPPGYIVTDDGVFRLVVGPDGSTHAVEVAPRPLLVVGRSDDVDTELEHMTLAWPGRDGPWTTASVPRAVASDGRALIVLSAKGAPVSTPHARALVLYLMAAEKACRAPVDRTMMRMGWDKECSSFIAGCEVYVPRGFDGQALRFNADGGVEQFARRYTRAGTPKGWLEAWAVCSEWPIAAASVYASCAAPFLAILGAPSFLVDWSARSGSGKTTSLRLASSVWGLPTEAGLIHSWSATPTFIERMTAAGCDLPVCLDETSRIPLAKRVEFAHLIYMLANGQGKGRASVTGTQERAAWKTVVLSTGEARLTSYTEDEGTRSRVISLTGYPLGDDGKGAERAELVAALTQRHHGHVGKALIEWIVNADHDWIRARHAEIVASYGKHPQLSTRTARRLAVYVATMELAAEVLHNRLKIPKPNKDPIAEVWRQVCAETRDTDRAADALRLIYEITVQRSNSFWGSHERLSDESWRTPPGGWLGCWPRENEWKHIGWGKAALERVLKDAGHVPDTIINEWKARGWLKQAKGSTTPTYPEIIGDKQTRVVAVKREAFIKVGAISSRTMPSLDWGEE